MSILSVYATNKSLLQLTKQDIGKLNILNVGFGILEQGEISLKNLTYIHAIREFKVINPNLKIYLSLASGLECSFSTACRTKEAREKVIRSIVALIKEWDFDGIDIDWEYPSGKEDRHNHTLLLKELREGLDTISAHKYRGLSIAAGSKSWYFDITELTESVRYLDYVNLMTYDINANEHVTMHHTCPAKMNTELVQEGSTEENIELFIKKGVPPEKLIIGAAFYSRQWKNVENKNNGLHSYAGSASEYGPVYTKLIRDYVNKNGYIRYWDEVAHAPYLFNGDNFITYEDEDSLKYKCYLVKKWKIAGIMAWEYSYDEEHTLIALIDDALK
ncbi:MAG: glycoside hydrolase family 18 protein [Zhenhengia sp.]|uniref:glycoside hydrolase family 18 protein n=1 Tax=Zhenhengia sp. TaxID=2944208 RepID=UPI0039913B63